MLKKTCLWALLLVSASALFCLCGCNTKMEAQDSEKTVDTDKTNRAAALAGERAGIYMILIGDSRADLEITSKSSAVTVGKDLFCSEDKPQVQRSAMVVIEDKDPVEVELEATPSVAGTFRIVCQGWGEGREHAYVECSKFEVNGNQVIPSEEFKSIDIYGYHIMLKDFNVAAGKPVKIKAIFSKISDERLAELAAAAERRAAARKTEKDDRK